MTMFKNPFFFGFGDSICRYSLSLLFRSYSLELPFGTFSAKILGYLLLGCIVAFHDEAGKFLLPKIRLCLVTGFCTGLVNKLNAISYTHKKKHNS